MFVCVCVCVCVCVQGVSPTPSKRMARRAMRGCVRRGSEQRLREYGTYSKVKARFWSWFPGRSPQKLSSCALFARQRT